MRMALKGSTRPVQTVHSQAPYQQYALVESGTQPAIRGRRLTANCSVLLAERAALAVRTPYATGGHCGELQAWQLEPIVKLDEVVRAVGEGRPHACARMPCG